MKKVSRLHNCIKKKLLGRSGASLSEVLVTVLIMSIAMAAITAGITSAVRDYHQVRTKPDAQTLMSTTITALSQDLQSATQAPSGEVNMFYTVNRECAVSFVNGADANKGIQIKLYSEDSQNGGVLKENGSFAAVPNPDNTKLYTKISSLTFTPDDASKTTSFGYFTYTITVHTTDTYAKSSEDDPIETQDVTVRSMLPVKVKALS